MKPDPPRRGHRRARQRPAWTHVRDRGAAHGISRPHVLAGDGHANRTGGGRRDHRALRRPGSSARFCAQRISRHVRVRKRPAETAAAAAEYTPVRPAGRCCTSRRTACARRSFLDRSRTSCHAILVPIRNLHGPRTRRSQRHGLSCYPQDRRLRLRRQRTGLITPARPSRRRLGRNRAEPGRARSFVDFECEVSVVAARGLDGTFVALSAWSQNEHQPDSRCHGRAGPGSGQRVARGRRDTRDGAREAGCGRCACASSFSSPKTVASSSTNLRRGRTTAVTSRSMRA